MGIRFFDADGYSVRPFTASWAALWRHVLELLVAEWYCSPIPLYTSLQSSNKSFRHCFPSVDSYLLNISRTST
jgi:hypothetical protein